MLIKNHVGRRKLKLEFSGVQWGTLVGCSYWVYSIAFLISIFFVLQIGERRYLNTLIGRQHYKLLWSFCDVDSSISNILISDEN